MEMKSVLWVVYCGGFAMSLSATADCRISACVHGAEVRQNSVLIYDGCPRGNGATVHERVAHRKEAIRIFNRLVRAGSCRNISDACKIEVDTFGATLEVHGVELQNDSSIGSSLPDETAGRLASAITTLEKFIDEGKCQSVASVPRKQQRETQKRRYYFDDNDRIYFKSGNPEDVHSIREEINSLVTQEVEPDYSSPLTRPFPLLGILIDPALEDAETDTNEEYLQKSKESKSTGNALMLISDTVMGGWGFGINVMKIVVPGAEYLPASIVEIFENSFDIWSNPLLEEPNVLCFFAPDETHSFLEGGHACMTESGIFIPDSREPDNFRIEWVMTEARLSRPR